MESSGFFTSKVVDGEYDRSYTAEQFARYFATFISNGIFVGGKALLVSTASDGMKVNVTSGDAWINGYWYKNDGVAQLELNVADGTQDRVDAIVVRWSNVNRSIELAVKTGAAASSPVNPTLDRNADVYELCLAYIKVPRGSTVVQQSNIVDVRLDSTVCGVVGALVNQWDMSQYGTQLNDYITKYMAQSDGSYNSFVEALDAWLIEYKEVSQQEFTSWFDSMKGQLSEDAAGNLQLEVDKLQSSVSGISNKLQSGLQMTVCNTLESLDLDSSVTSIAVNELYSAVQAASILVLEIASGQIAVNGEDSGIALSGLPQTNGNGLLVICKGTSRGFAMAECAGRQYECNVTTGTWYKLSIDDEVAVALDKLVSIESGGADSVLISEQSSAILGVKYTTKTVLESVPSSLTALASAVNALSTGKQKVLTNPLVQANVVNNLTSTATALPLSAAMGKKLYDERTVSSLNASSASFSKGNNKVFKTVTLQPGTYLLNFLASGGTDGDTEKFDLCITTGSVIDQSQSNVNRFATGIENAAVTTVMTFTAATTIKFIYNATIASSALGAAYMYAAAVKLC